MFRRGCARKPVAQLRGGEGGFEASAASALAQAIRRGVDDDVPELARGSVQPVHDAAVDDGGGADAVADAHHQQIMARVAFGHLCDADCGHAAYDGDGQAHALLEVFAKGQVVPFEMRRGSDDPVCVDDAGGADADAENGGLGLLEHRLDHAFEQREGVGADSTRARDGRVEQLGSGQVEERALDLVGARDRDGGDRSGGADEVQRASGGSRALRGAYALLGHDALGDQLGDDTGDRHLREARRTSQLGARRTGGALQQAQHQGAVMATGVLRA